MAIEIPEFDVKLVPMEWLKPDSTNPNVMTMEEENALERVMRKFGFLSPIICDMKGNIVDGEHRYKAYKKMKKETIPAYVIDIDSISKKMLRQLMNKLRGVHDRQKDALEFKELMNEGKLETLADMLARPVNEFTSMLQSPDELNQDANPTKGYEESFLSGNIKQITIYMMNEKYEETLPKLAKIMEEHNFDNHTDVFFLLLQEHEAKNNPS